MKRRNFLKSLFGVVAVPSLCTAKLLKNNESKNVGIGLINFDSIKINGTFDEWIESIRTEVERLLVAKNKYDNVYSVSVKPDDWGLEKIRSIPAKMILIAHVGIRGLTIFDSARNIVYFSLAKFEFKHNKHSKKGLTSLVNVRFIDMMWSLEDRRENLFKLLKRLDPKHETPNDYLH